MICDHHRLVLASCLAAPHIDAETARRMQDDITGQCRDCLRLSGDLIAALVHMRKKRGMTAEDVARRAGATLGWVLAFESGRTDPWLSEIRLYALCIHARIERTITPIGRAA